MSVDLAPPVAGGELQAIIRLAAPGACPEDVDGSGQVDGDDLLAVILAWGPCPGWRVFTAYR